MKISKIFNEIKDTFSWKDHGPEEERFFYFFWDLVHYYKGIVSRYSPDFDLDPSEISDTLKGAIKEFSIGLMKVKSGLSHPIDLNNINRYGWEWIMKYSRLLIYRNHGSDLEKNETEINSHKGSLTGIFKDPVRIGYKKRYHGTSL